MELKDLVGKHILSGVDMSHKAIERWVGNFENCQVINFTLDGITYSAIEDPSDGYRSCMREICVSDTVTTNTFPGQEVMAIMESEERRRSEESNILDLIDTQTGKLVMSVGTGSTDDLYPYWVAEFTPENMAINQRRGGGEL